ncbi:acyl-CoA carboxylase subunit epsilon [Streptomyces sp. NPDC001393]
MPDPLPRDAAQQARRPAVAQARQPAAVTPGRPERQGGVRVLRGNPSHEDLAVLTVVLSAVTRRAAAVSAGPGPARAGWGRAEEGPCRSAGSWRAGSRGWAGSQGWGRGRSRA